MSITIEQLVDALEQAGVVYRDKFGIGNALREDVELTPFLTLATEYLNKSTNAPEGAE